MSSAPTWQHELGLAIQSARRQARLSQEDVADTLGVRQSSVSQWERGITAPKTKHLLLLLNLFGAVLVRMLVIEEATSDAETGDHERTTDKAAHMPT